MAKRLIKKSEGTNIIAVIGDEDTVTGFLLTGIGERSTKGETNFLIVDSSIIIYRQCPLTFSCILETPTKLIEDTFKRFLKTPNVSVILINQHVNHYYADALINYALLIIDCRKRTKTFN